MTAVRRWVNEGAGFLLGQVQNRREQGVFVRRADPCQPTLYCLQWDFFFLTHPMLRGWLCNLPKLLNLCEVSADDLAQLMQTPFSTFLNSHGKRARSCGLLVITRTHIYTPHLDSNLRNVWNRAFNIVRTWGKSITSPTSPFCLPHIRVGGEHCSISQHHLKPGSQTFYDCGEKWIWDRGNSPCLSSRQAHFLAPCSPLDLFSLVAWCGGFYLSNTNGWGPE